MQRLFIFLILSGRAFLSCGQQQDTSNQEDDFGDFSNHYLVPVEGYFDMYNYQHDYYSKIHSILFNGLEERPVIRFQVMPSFTPESVLDIEFDKKDNKHYLIYHICQQMIWCNPEPNRITVNKFRTEIDEKSVDLIKSLFDIAIAQVRYPKIIQSANSEEILIPSIMLDGTSYYFTIGMIGYPLRSGYTRSPSKGTKMEKLVDIGEKLIELAQSESEKVTLDKNLQKEIEELTVWLKK